MPSCTVQCVRGHPCQEGLTLQNKHIFLKRKALFVSELTLLIDSSGFLGHEHAKWCRPINCIFTVIAV